eukprot:807325-Pleurochrysis_carterae.AAC.1
MGCSRMGFQEWGVQGWGVMDGHEGRRVVCTGSWRGERSAALGRGTDAAVLPAVPLAASMSLFLSSCAQVSNLRSFTIEVSLVNKDDNSPVPNNLALRVRRRKRRARAEW